MQYRYVITAITENTPHVLQRVAGLFSRLRINIEHLTVDAVANENTSHFSITIYSDQKTVARLIQQLKRIIELIDVSIRSKNTLPTNP